MKQALYIILCITLGIAGCTTESDRMRMRAGLDSINVRNRNGQPFAVNEVQPYVDFFDEHGTPNDRLLAHYLLGLAYSDHGEAPMALRCYQDAIDCADTLSADCDYGQLARVYGQMGNIFYYQGLYRKQLECQQNAMRFAWIGEDTLASLMSYEQEGFAYLGLKDTAAAMLVVEDIAKKYTELGYTSDAAIALGGNIRPLIENGNYIKAKDYMTIYEAQSGRFDASGNIEHGREVYYNMKGFYYLYINKLDSAEYYFRKELRDGKDLNNQHGGAKGLSELYQILNMSDSMAKYYRYAYAMNDSVYAQKTTKEVKRLQAMYDYTRNQEIARKKSEEARQNKERLRLLFTLFIGFVITIVILAYKFIRKRRDGLVLYMQSLEELKLLRAEKAALCQHKEEYCQILLEKDKKIDYLEQRVKKYGKQVYFKTANAERCLKESPVYKDFEKKAIHGQYLVEEDWKKIKILVSEYLPSFDDFLATNLHRLKGCEYQIMILLRLHFKPVDIAGMIGLSKSQISQNCTEIMKKIFDTKGSSKELSAKLEKIF
jgi:hypothetical protein